MKLRKFEVKDGQAVMSNLGEFFHKNDIELKLLEEKRNIDACLERYVGKDENEISDWEKKHKYKFEVQSEIIDHLLIEFR